MDYYDRYQTIIKEYNEEKNRAEIERIFDELTKLAQDLIEEEKRHIGEGFSSDEELSMFDLLFKADLSKQLKQRIAVQIANIYKKTGAE